MERDDDERQSSNPRVDGDASDERVSAERRQQELLGGSDGEALQLYEV